MKKLIALRDHILTLGITTEKQCTAYVDLLGSKAAGRPLDGDSDKVVISECRYTARFYMTGYPFLRYPIGQLGASISAWLLDNDSSRKANFEVVINIDVNDKNGEDGESAELEFEVLFDENLIIEPDANGLIRYRDDRWSIV